VLTRDKLVNVLLFMERVTVTGKEALAWTQTYEAVTKEIETLNAQQGSKENPS